MDNSGRTITNVDDGVPDYAVRTLNVRPYRAIQCPVEGCCGCLFEGEVIGDISCNECGQWFEIVLIPTG